MNNETNDETNDKKEAWEVRTYDTPTHDGKVYDVSIKIWASGTDSIKNPRIFQEKLAAVMNEIYGWANTGNLETGTAPRIDQQTTQPGLQ